MSSDPYLVLQTEPPVVAESLIAQVIDEAYGLRGELARQDSERDLNYHLRAGDGREYVFKIANRSESSDVTRFQVEALQYLEHAAANLPVPRVVETLDGQFLTTVHDEQGRPHSARMLTWLAGTPLRDAAPLPGSIGVLGQTLAELGIALRGFEHPAADYALLWDIRQASHLGAQLESIPDDALRAECASRLADLSG